MIKFIEFFTELEWDIDMKEWVVSKDLSDCINEWIYTFNPHIIDIQYASVTIDDTVQTSALIQYKIEK